VIYQDERWADQDNFVKWDDYWLADARLGFEAESWSILAYVDNVFDDDTIKSGGSGPDFGRAITDMGFSGGLVRSHFFGPLPMPRNFGVRLNYNF